ncbi:MAG: choice-of-anchor D domain-containing protein [Acidobacteria bacterium]|nr:choice-of-anchor D domain-containing protein [Acidobacteriota bacterium]
MKRYGLPTRINNYIGASGPLKNATYLIYYYEAHPGFKSRHMMDFPGQDSLYTGQNQPVKKTDTTYYEETGKWGALKQVKRWKTGPTYLAWDYEYESPEPSTVTIKVDPPGVAEKETIGYHHGIKNSASAPDFSSLTRGINSQDSSIASEKWQDEGIKTYGYDNLGRMTQVDLPSSINDIAYDWRPAGANSVVITQGTNTVTKYWDGMGRDTGFTETGDGLTLHSRRSLDAEGRVVAESKGAVDDDYVYFYTYTYNAAGQVTSITDPMGETTSIAYQGTTKTVTDPEGHATTYSYGDLPGLPTLVTDAMGKSAVYTYDAAGRLTSVLFNGTRNHVYTYDGLDNVLTESHPETDTITYGYNAENLLSSKTWGGSTLGFNYDLSRRLYRTTATTGGVVDIVDYSFSTITGRVVSAVDLTTGWRRETLSRDLFGNVTSERVTIPGLAPKTLTYTYDANLNPTGWKEATNPGDGLVVSYNALNMPEGVQFDPNGTDHPLVNSVTYGPNKMPAGISFANQTAYTAVYNQAGMPTTVSLNRGGTMLYDAGYEYDGAGNILSITSTAPALTATFGYDALNRLISAAYSSGSPSTYSYQYDEYGNMLNATGAIGFPHTYNNKNQVPQSEGFYYDPRGNLLTSGGNIYYWDAQNRLQYIQNTSGAVIGKYLYDDRGLRLMAVPPLPEINVKHDEVDIPSGGEAYLSAAVGQTFEETLVIQNLGDANLSLGSLEITDDAEDNFDFVQPASPVLPTGSTNLTVRFHPRSAGQKVALLHIPSNDVNEADYHVNLFGNYQPEIAIPQAPDGGDFDFGEIEIGDFWEQTFTIQNLGNKDLLLYGDPIVVITGPDADHFEVISQPDTLNDPSPLPIGPSPSKTFVIRFSANSEGLKTAAISIVNNDWNENPYDITLLGTGIIGPNKIVEDTAFVVTSPVEGEELVPGAVHLITWTGAEEVKEVKIEYSLDNGSVFHTIVERTANTGSYPWTVPPVLSASCLVRVSGVDGTATEGETLSLEFKLKMSSSAIEADTEGLTVRATLPDAKTATSWAAEVALSADRIRYAGADGGKLTAFLDRWHTVRLLLSYRTMTAGVWLDGKPLLDGVPLVQGSWAGSSPEFVVRSATTAGVRIEDFEARYRDAVLRPVVEGEEVSQTLIRDSFEAYEPATFPRQGGWQAASAEAIDVARDVVQPKAQRGKEKQSTVSEGRIGKQTGNESISSREQGVKDALQEPANADRLREDLKAVVDEEDSVTGLRSFKLIVDAPGEIVIAKRLSLPAEAPFGVSDGAFSIGGIGSDIPVQRVSRSRVLEGLRVDKEERTRREDDPASGQGLRRAEVPLMTGRSGTTRSSEDSNDQTMKLMSASPVGNFYIYSFDGKLLQVYDVFGALLKDFIYMGSRLIAEYDHVGACFLYYTPDQINTTRVITDQGGNVVYSATYAPYGEIRTQQGTVDPLPKFSGKERDPESQLDYFGARYYDRNIYRFISVDPKINIANSVHDSQRLNLYAYCGNKPIGFVDLDGRDIKPIKIAGNGIVLIDPSFGAEINQWFRYCEYFGIHISINEAYRTKWTTARYRATDPEKTAKGISLHELGLAIDINWSMLTPLQRFFAAILAPPDIKWGVHFSPKSEPWHWYKDYVGSDMQEDAKRCFLDLIDYCMILAQPPDIYSEGMGWTGDKH